MIHLINPNESRILENAGDRVPIGLRSIAANTPGAKVYDLNHMTWDEYTADFEKDNPLAVGVSVYTSPIVPEALDIAKKLRGRTRLIAGGYHATAMPETLLPYFDSVVVGEGETSMADAVEFDGVIAGRSHDLGDLLSPGFRGMSDYQMQQSGKRTGTLITSRGCPYSCSFCGKLEDKVRKEPNHKVLGQMSELRAEGFEALYFLDDVFTLDIERMRRIVHNVGLPYRVTTRANLINPEKITLLKNTGCDWISLGIESGDDNILNYARKGMTTEDNLVAVNLAGEVGINVKGFFIIGLPGETEKTARKTINFAHTLKDYGLTSADFYALCAFPGTPVWRNPDKFGIKITDFDYTKYLQAGVDVPGVFCETEELGADRIRELLIEAKELWK